MNKYILTLAAVIIAFPAAIQASESDNLLQAAVIMKAVDLSKNIPALQGAFEKIAADMLKSSVSDADFKAWANDVANKFNSKYGTNINPQNMTRQDVIDALKKAIASQFSNKIAANNDMTIMLALNKTTAPTTKPAATSTSNKAEDMLKTVLKESTAAAAKTLKDPKTMKAIFDAAKTGVVALKDNMPAIIETVGGNIDSIVTTLKDAASSAAGAIGALAF